MMTIEVAWDDPAKTIISYTFLPGWTLEEFYRVYDQAADMLRESTGKVIGIVVDDTRGAIPPANALSAFRRTVNRGDLPLVVVGGQQLSMLLLKVAEETNARRRQIFYAKTMEEARDLLRNNAEANIDE
jgi:hypothetical protein